VKRRAILFILVAALALIPLCSAPLFAQAGGVAAERGQADAFLEQAGTSLAAGSIDQARALIASALELSPDYSEALYLRARAGLSDRGMTLAAIEDIRAALRSGTWKTTDPAMAERTLGEALLRTGEVAEARRLLERRAATHPEDAFNMLLLARALGKSSDVAGEERVLVNAAARFPLVDDFRLVSAAILDRRGKRAAARDVVATGLKVNPKSLPLLLSMARFERTAKARVAAVDLYVQKGGADPLSAVLGLESSTKDRRKYLDLFLNQGGLARQDLVDRVAGAVRGTKDLSSSLQSALSQYSGARSLDSDEDGFWEQQWIFDKGTVTGWRREPAQDGAAQYSARFAGGEPAAFTYDPAPGVQVALSYSRYPFIDTADVKPGGKLFLVPYSLQCAILQRRGGGGFTGLAPGVASKIQVPSLEQLRKGAYKLEEYASDGIGLLRRIELSHGQTVYTEEDTDGDGRIDHRLWHQNGIAVRGERSLTGDGVYQVKETWQDGALASEAEDTDGDGKVDFRQSYGANPVKSWDYDEDGRVDSRELRRPGGTVVREFATSGNGVFDVSVEWQGARISKVTTGGTPLPVTTDLVRGITWIGRPANPGARLDPMLPDGMQPIGGKHYLVFRYQGVVYAEEMK
jgi:tetratricopeptide (TPR) repeat protein